MIGRYAIPDDAIGLPRHSPRLWVFKDVGKRVARCHGCAEPIQKGTERYVFHFMGFVKRYANGGVSAQQRIYLHPCCVASPETARTGRTCWECGSEDIPKSTGKNVAITRTMWVWLCETCITDSKYCVCQNCGMTFPKYRVSKVLKVPENSWLPVAANIEWICDGCEETDEFYTVRSKKRAERAEKEFEARYHSTLRRIEENGVYG